MSVSDAHTDGTVVQYTKTIAVDPKMKEQAWEVAHDTIPETEDFERNSDERELHRYIGELGEIAFKQYLEETLHSYRHKGGYKHADFYLKSDDDQEVSIDVKTRIDPNNRDLIIKQDVQHDVYVLQYVNWVNDRIQNEVESIEIVGFIQLELAKNVARKFSPHSSDNYRPKLLVEREHINPLFCFDL